MNAYECSLWLESLDVEIVRVLQKVSTDIIGCDLSKQSHSLIVRVDNGEECDCIVKTLATLSHVITDKPTRRVKKAKPTKQLSNQYHTVRSLLDGKEVSQTVGEHSLITRLAQQGD